MTTDACGVCGADFVPGVDACVNCGEPREREPEPNVQIWALTVSGMKVWTPEEIAERERKDAERQHLSDRLTQARALEYATDLDGAIAIYESFILEKSRISPPYQRLAIIYRRMKRPADEERVVRAALEFVGHQYAGAWFVVRLAKILAEQRKAAAKALEPPKVKRVRRPKDAPPP